MWYRKVLLDGPPLPGGAWAHTETPEAGPFTNTRIPVKTQMRGKNGKELICTISIIFLSGLVLTVFSEQ